MIHLKERTFGEILQTLNTPGTEREVTDIQNLANRASN